jgi:hypothetical protein
MATNRDLLKEAIADAKAVKETAIANAKAALEEAFTPYLKEKLSMKLNEIDEEMYGEVDDTMEEMVDSEDTNEEISLDELLAELDEESSKDELYEAEEEEGEEEMAIEDMSEDDLKSFIEDVIKDMVSAGELEAGHEGMEDEEGYEGEEEMDMEDEGEMDMEAEEEEININELLAELEETNLSEEENVNEGSIIDIFQQFMQDVGGSDDLVSKLTGAIAAVGVGLGTLTLALGNKTFRNELKDALKQDWNESKLSQWIKSNLPGKKSSTLVKSEMEEQLDELRNELNEVNLLNAKLLYTNKIFRNKSLTESQKVKVLTAFDKATSKKEAQLVYETLLESLKVSTTTKAPIKESLGSASKTLGGVTSKPIIENDAFSRMRELAFGNKK